MQTMGILVNYLQLSSIIRERIECCEVFANNEYINELSTLQFNQKIKDRIVYEQFAMQTMGILVNYLHLSSTRRRNIDWMEVFAHNMYISELSTVQFYQKIKDRIAGI